MSVPLPIAFAAVAALLGAVWLGFEMRHSPRRPRPSFVNEEPMEAIFIEDEPEYRPRTVAPAAFPIEALVANAFEPVAPVAEPDPEPRAAPVAIAPAPGPEPMVIPVAPEVGILADRVAALADAISRLAEKIDAHTVEPPVVIAPAPMPAPVAGARADDVVPESKPERVASPTARNDAAAVDDDMFAWPNDEDLERFARGQGRRDDA